MPHDYPKFDGSQLCAQTDPELFFPVKGDHSSSRTARALCARCPWLMECFEYAVKYKLMGIWGGTTERERYAYQKKHGIKPLEVSSGLK